MKDLLTFLLEGLTGKSNFSIEEAEENSNLTLNILADPLDIGLIIGKGGQTISAIQSIMQVKGRLENKSVYVSVAEKKV